MLQEAYLGFGLGFPSYRNQSVDLQNKSTNWFLYDGNIVR